MTLLDNSAPAPTTWAPATEEAPRTRAEWRLADTDFWAASYRGYFGGTIDKQGDHYFVRDTFASYIGDYSDLAMAQRRLEDHLESLLTEQRDRP
ncbi:hypothetical protein [Mycetocola zhadangensis]|uniref:Uncharacterized protein n=1 Tax=Mycetocola zhadangensis TaxID=1164595 RepID=A0A3L7J273_9MICO|nr:hypothetical protein [Mycetocola zhadangensis]RLQ84519.1 hypothetical protein D9V28_10110 [Mycetocola zhadangensis]GGE92267.1 hypothetical protein GCM10011313_13970 [Mycetocola zhadangensis]